MVEVKIMIRNCDSSSQYNIRSSILLWHEFHQAVAAFPRAPQYRAANRVLPSANMYSVYIYTYIYTYDTVWHAFVFFFAGAPVPLGAFLIEDAKLGNLMTVPKGSKLVSVDDTGTADLPFERARQVALSAGKDSVLVFEQG